jgi:hypothetical protein
MAWRLPTRIHLLKFPASPNSTQWVCGGGGGKTLIHGPLEDAELQQCINAPLWLCCRDKERWLQVGQDKTARDMVCPWQPLPTSPTPET